MFFLIPGLLLLLHLTYGSAASDGSWGEWSEWTSCTVSCGSGTRKRFRACDPAPAVGGRWCQGKYLQMEDCDTNVPCPVAGGWSNWSQWTACSSTCGQGTTHRYRSCSNPLPTMGGKPCSGSPQESDSCVALKACPRDGKWSQWSQWSSCSVTCGEGGSIHRYRACNNPPPQAEGKPCEGPSRDTQACDANQPCPVNGQWSEWTEWTECSVSCGQGEKMRRRACDDPPPQHGGKDCNHTEAGELQIYSCTANIVHCPVNGGWSEWGSWGACHSADCSTAAGLSRSFRQRSCNAPLPAHNGSMCQGTFLDAGLCPQPVNCKVDGGWGEWSSWSCTAFVASRKRLCDSPPPSKNGKNCKGKEADIYLKNEDREEYSEACPQFPSDDEDLGEPGSGSGQGNNDEEAEDDDQNI